MSAREFTITLPPCTKHQPPNNTIKTLGPLVLVGANGAGKSRLAIWLENQDHRNRHRVSAQRSISFPQSFQSTSMEKAQNAFFYGYEGPMPNPLQQRFTQRWGGRHDHLLSDFDKLMRLLVLQAAQVWEAYTGKMRCQSTYEPPPESKIDVIRRIWQEVLPNRELTSRGVEFEVKQRGGRVSFAPQEMSDGERVIFYLIGQCLCAPKDGTIILDEPELHIHQALQARLWDAVEAERPDCLFVYITHDLEFAASRKGGTCIWLHEYKGNNQWEWEKLPENSALPDALLLELLGSRKPVLLVEGKVNGTDERLYRALYPNHHVMAFGGCEQVINATASCRALKQRGEVRIDTVGLVDRDGRSSEDVASLGAVGVKVLEWAEIENLLLCEEVLAHATEALLHPSPADLIAEVKKQVLERLTPEAERVACELAGREIDRVLHSWKWNHKDGDSLKTSLDAHLSQIDKDKIIDAWRQRVQNIIAAGDYEAALRIYPNKGLLKIASDALGTKYADYLLRRINRPEGQSLVEALRQKAPTFQS